MKNILGILFTILSLQIFGQSDAIEKYFKDYSENDQFSVVYVSPKMFQMIGKATSGVSDQEYLDIVKDLKGLRILSTENNGMKYYKEANTRINAKEYEELMTVRDRNENIRFITKESNGIISELLLLVGGSNEFVMMSFVGNINLDKIAKLSKKLDIQGAEHLDKAVKNRK
jgi:hypothetical protein